MSWSCLNLVREVSSYIVGTTHKSTILVPHAVLSILLLQVLLVASISVTVEFGNRADQSEIQELQGTMQSLQNNGQNFSVLQYSLKRVPGCLFGGTDQAGKVEWRQMNTKTAQLQNAHITPHKPEEFTEQLEAISHLINPILK